MKFFNIAIVGLALSSASAFAADCAAPAVPELPDGASASMEQVLKGQKAVKAFQAANLEYMSCLEPGMTAAQTAIDEGTEGAAEKYEEIQSSYNAAVSAEEGVAGQFNTEIREYKAANPS